MTDFEQTCLRRRAIHQELHQAVQRSQRSEGEVVERIDEIKTKGKKELLLLLSAWLLEVKSPHTLSEAERREIQSLTQMSLDRWVQLQGLAVQIEKDLSGANSRKKEAVAALQKKAPFGGATKAFADTESRTQIHQLQGNVAAAQSYRESLTRALTDNEANRQALGKIFFRDCLAQPDKLGRTQVLGKEASAIASRVNGEVNTVWAAHQTQQTKELARMAQLVESLQASRQDHSLSLPEADKEHAQRNRLG